MSDNTAQQSRLLRLPGELRNRIYEYARETGPVGYHAVQLSGPTHTDTVTRIGQPLFLGLTRVCRLIRQEFRPQYIKHTVFCTRLLDTSNLIKSFVLPHGADSQANVLVDFGCLTGRIPVNILPLLHQLRQTPLVTVRAHYLGDIEVEEDLGTLLDDCRGQLFESISLCMSHVVLKMDGHSTRPHPVEVQFVAHGNKPGLDSMKESFKLWCEINSARRNSENGLVFKALSVTFLSRK